MNRASDSLHPDCSKELIADYQDGELDPAECELVESHLSECGSCKNYLNSLKMVATSLEIMLDRKDLDIPAEFTKRITTAAESSTDELRSSKEKTRALFVFAGLAGLTALIIGIGGSGVSSAVSVVLDQFYAFGSFVGNLFYTVAIGFSVIVGSVCAKMLFGSTVTILVVLAILITSILIFSKHIRQFYRF